MTQDPASFVAIGAATAPASPAMANAVPPARFGPAAVWALDLGSGAARQLASHDEKVAMLRRSPVDDRLIYGIDRGGDERQQLLLIDPQAAQPEPKALTDDPGSNP